MKTNKINTEKLQTKNLRAALVETACEVLGLDAAVAGKMSSDDLTARFAAAGFDEESTYAALVDEFGFGNCGMPQDISELCLPSLVTLWIECGQEYAAAKVLLRKIAESQAFVAAKAPKAPKAPKAAPFAALDEGFGWNPAPKASREVRSYEVSPLSIIRDMISAGQFTKRDIKAAILERVPTVKASYLNTVLGRITRAGQSPLKADAVVDPNTLVVTWAI